MDQAALIGITAISTIAVQFVLTVINRRFARADEKRIYQRNRSAEDKRRFQTETINTLSEIFALADRIFALTQDIVHLQGKPETPTNRDKFKVLVSERMNEKVALNAKLNFLVLVASGEVADATDAFVTSIHLHSIPNVNLIESTAAYRRSVDLKKELIAIARRDLGVELADRVNS